MWQCTEWETYMKSMDTLKKIESKEINVIKLVIHHSWGHYNIGTMCWQIFFNSFIQMGLAFFLYTCQNLRVRIMVYKCPSVCPSVRPSVCPSVCLSGVNMSHCNLRMTYPNFMKLDIVLSYDGQTIYILFGENKIWTFWVMRLCNYNRGGVFFTCRAVSQKRFMIIA